jgi:DNA-binding winged helix-turn-helix (wHTH) protein
MEHVVETPAGGEVVGKGALMARVWPDRMVEHLPKTQPIYTQV